MGLAVGSCATNVDDDDTETVETDEYTPMLTVDAEDESSLLRPDPDDIDDNEHLQVVLVAV